MSQKNCWLIFMENSKNSPVSKSGNSPILLPIFLSTGASGWFLCRVPNCALTNKLCPHKAQKRMKDIFLCIHVSTALCIKSPKNISTIAIFSVMFIYLGLVFLRRYYCGSSIVFNICCHECPEIINKSSSPYEDNHEEILPNLEVAFPVHHQVLLEVSCLCSSPPSPPPPSFCLARSFLCLHHQKMFISSP